MVPDTEILTRERLAAAVARIEFSREMTLGLLEDLEPSEWFWQPADGMNSIGWHVGHLAFAEYFLCLKRLRDRTEADRSLIPTAFLKRYKQGSQPSGDPEHNHSPEEILATLTGVHEQAVTELADYTDQQLLVPSRPQHPVFDDKMGAVEWCSQHELMHAGQITTLRRLLGKTPRW